MRANPIAIIVALFIAEMTVTFEGAMIYAALPTLNSVFGDPVKAGALLTSHMLIAAATAPVAGRYGDITGRKRVIVALLVFALLGTLLSALTSNFALILVGRALQGLSAAVLPLSIGVIRQTWSAGRVALGVGLLTTSQGVGAALGVLLGGWIIDHYAWQSLFFASAVLLMISIVAVLLWVPMTPGNPTKRPIDWIEGLMPVPAIASLLFAINLIRKAGWLDPRVLGLTAFGIVVLALWARRSLRSEEPFIDLRLFKLRNFAVINGITVLIGMGTMQIIYVFAAYMQSPKWTMVGLGVTATMAGVAKLPSNFCSFFAGPLSGLMSQRLGDRATVMTGAMLATLGWIVSLTMPATIVHVVAVLIVISFGTTILQAAIPNVVVSAVPEKRTSEAVGTMSVLRGIAAALGAQMIAMLLASHTVTAPQGGAKFPSEEAFRLTMLVMIGLTLVGVLLAMLLRKQDSSIRSPLERAVG